MKLSHPLICKRAKARRLEPIMISNVTLTTKEKGLLEDQKKHEQTCILKYSNYANLASDQQLKDIFNSNKQQEVDHVKSIDQLLSGQIPSINNQQSSNSTGQQSSFSTSQPSSSSNSASNSSSFKSSDKDLCSDILMTEKFVSGAYDTALFEFREPAVRDVLNHIQKEEQKHGESVFQYMESKGMYNPK